jgi:hypothetical protein
MTFGENLCRSGCRYCRGLAAAAAIAIDCHALSPVMNEPLTALFFPVAGMRPGDLKLLSEFAPLMTSGC